MRLWLDAVLSVLFAPDCAACHAPLAEPTRGTVCPQCWQGIHPITPPWCSTCGDALPPTAAPNTTCARCRSRTPLVARARALGVHEGALRAIVHALKYDGRRSLARPLGQLMRERAADLLATAQAAVPVPLHASRQRVRGFNQAEDLARHLGLPVVMAMARVRATEMQADLPAHQREGNVRDAFRTTPAAMALVGHSVVLVDDVSTTGATLNACARPLLAAGVGPIYAVTAARAVTIRR